MKKIFLTASVILMAISATLANKADRDARKEARHEKREAKKELRNERREEDKNEVSYRTTQQFAEDFPNAKNVIFEKTKNYDEVIFTSDRKKLQAYYGYDGQLIGTTHKEKFSALPIIAQREIKKRYKDYAVDEVTLFHDNENNDADMMLFGTLFEDADNYFVSLKKENHEVVVKVNTFGEVSYFTEMK